MERVLGTTGYRPGAKKLFDKLVCNKHVPRYQSVTIVTYNDQIRDTLDKEVQKWANTLDPAREGSLGADLVKAILEAEKQTTTSRKRKREAGDPGDLALGEDDFEEGIVERIEPAPAQPV
jgi:hypothetical protein